VLGVKKPATTINDNVNNTRKGKDNSDSDDDDKDDRKPPARRTTTTTTTTTNTTTNTTGSTQDLRSNTGHDACIDLISIDEDDEYDEYGYKDEDEVVVVGTTDISMQRRREQELAQEAKDREIAMKIQQELEIADQQEAEKAKELNEKGMTKTTVGKAVKFVQGLLDIETQLQSLTSKHPGFLQIVARDDIVYLAERTFIQQETFRLAGVPYHFDLGFHYTKPEYLASIKTGGLLTKKDRDSRNVSAQHNGSAYGDGVYTCDNPRGTWNQRYGNTGLLVARLQGKTGSIRDKNPDNIHTVISQSNKWAVLKTSEQCIALFQYDGTQLTWKGNDCPSVVVLKPLCEKVQNLINDLLNAETTQPESPMAKSSSLPVTFGTVVPRAAAPSGFGGAAMPSLFSLFGTGPPSTVAVPTAPAPVAQPPLPSFSSVVSYQMRSDKKVSSPLGLAPRGDMPSGTMVTTQLAFPCGGCPTSLMIQYTINHGRQASFHPYPNQVFAGATKHAYLPADAQGRKLLARLEEAFRCGYTFNIVADAQCPQKYRVSDFLIPHRTMLSGGPSTNGFPDPHYFNLCHSVLDALSVKRF
jgi:hypothetical protein